jgi:flagellar hook-associated protein 2
MSVVGLSFGTPTSGSGFDVSSTVSQIVANLENVETPWKTKLSSLESQGSVISKLGTLLSAVSSDISDLTDVTGIMSEKTGSSSDTNVVTLSSATSSAQAGTHTIAVKNLAATSSGYFTAVSSASDTLAGSITIQVGTTGAAQTITLDSTNDTLTTLAKAINNANMGVTANVLSDSAGSRLSLVSGTSGASGQLTISSSITDSSSSNASLSYTTSTTGKDASLIVDGITLTSSTNTISNMIPGITFQILSSSSTDTSGDYNAVQVVIGNNTTGVESALESFVVDYNSLVSAMNAQEGTDSSGNNEPLYGSPTLSLLQQQLISGINNSNPNGYLDSVSTTEGATLSGSIVIQVGTGTAQTIAIDSSNNTIASLATSINNAGIGVTASVTTKNGASTLELLSQTSGSSGALKVTSHLSEVDSTALSYSGTSGSSTVTSSGTFTSISDASDSLSGTMTIQVGSGTTHTISVDSSSNTLAGLANTINSASIGVTASVVSNSDGTYSLQLTSGTSGSDGTLTVSSSILDTSNTTSTSLAYNDSSDLTTLSSLGITVSSSLNGTLSLDLTTLNSQLNSDYSSVMGFFQNIGSWGADFKTTLTGAGTSSSTGILALELTAISTSESTMNAQISREESTISAERVQLTKELISANEVLQAIPSKLSEVNEIYSAISGYNTSS